MSTVMYMHKISKENLSETVRTIRKAYRDNNLYVNKIQNGNVDLRELDELEAMMVKHREDVSLQLFDFDTFYLFRMTGGGYWLMNHCKELGIESVSYDTRTDIPDEDLVNEIYVDPIDRMINDREYLEVGIFGHKDLFNIWWDSNEKTN